MRSRMHWPMSGAIPVFALAPLLGAFGVTPLAAQGWIEPHPRVIRDFAVMKLRTHVRVSVDGRIARVEVEEWFQNRGPGLAEGDYLYPLPGEAVFANFSLFQGDRELRGETMDAARARAIYEEIVRRKRDPALIELMGHGLIRSRVFPIAPGETRRITLRYTQVLERAGAALQFRYAAGGRHGSGPRPVSILLVDPSERSSRPPPMREPAPLTFVLAVEDGSLFRDPFSPTHEVRVERDGGRLTVRPAAELSGDFALFLPLARGLVGVTVAAHRVSGEDGFFLLTLSPGPASGRSVARDVTAVVDVSGSMQGEKLEQVKAALRQLLASLSGEDRFRLIAFSNGAVTHAPDWTEVGSESLADARRWVDALQAEGGTNIAGALTEAFRAASPAARLPIVLFLTDGLPSVGEQNPERIAEAAERWRGRARVFAFGVGYDVNTYLLDRLSEAGRGSTEYVEPGEDVEIAVSALAAKIQHPVLTELEIADAPVRLREIYPLSLPDLFAGEELVIFGRYEAPDAGAEATGVVRVSGRRAGRVESYAAEASFPRHEPGNDFIPRLWAARKLGVLTRQIRLHGANPELVEQARELALRYGLLSEFTAYLVQEPELELARRDPAGAAAALPWFAPEQATGRAAVVAAEAARMQREVRSAQQLAAAEADLATIAPTGMAGATAGVRRIVAGRVFVLEDGVWTDAAHRREQRIAEIEPFGDAYFRLLRELPELVPYLREFDSVLVAGKALGIQVRAGGEARLGDAEVGRIVREFRRG